MDWREYIEQRPDVMLGKPVIKGTRITVELILEELGDGADFDDILDAHPMIRPEHIRAALAFASTAIGSEAVLFSN